MKNLQRTKEWDNDRKFRFTGSRISELLGIKGIGKTGESYIFEVVYKSLFEDLEENFESYDMTIGKEREPLAFNKLSEILGERFISIEKCGFFKWGKYGGASPDGITSDDAIIEIKCPKAKTFFNVVLNNYVDPSYYDQMQKEMLSANKKKAYYFNYFVDLNGKEYWHLIEIERDEKRIEFIKSRIEEASVIAEEYKQKLINNLQCTQQ